MMKKIFSAMMAFAILFATSCQSDLDTAATTGDVAEVTFSLTTEDATRAYGDGATATVLKYAVYDADGVILPQQTKEDATINGSTTVRFTLTSGKSYSFIFWAGAADAPYTVDLANKTMTVNYTGATSNAENRDAFYAYKEVNVAGNSTFTVELKRPFAQLNIGTNDYAASEAAGYAPTQTAVKVKSIYNTLNLATGVATGDAEITFDYAAIPDGETFPVEDYDYLAMNYLLVGQNAGDKQVVDIVFSHKEDTGDETSRTVGSVPVQRNYRTNIYGKLLTNDLDINIEIKPGFGEPSNEMDALHKAAIEGGEYTLTEDITLTAPLEVGANLVLNLNGKTITGSFSKYDGHIIKNNGTLKLVGGTVSSTGANGGSAIANYGTLTVEGTKIIGASVRENSDWPAYPINNYGNSMTLKDVEIEGYQGAIACGTAGTTTLENCTIVKKYLNTSSHVFYIIHDEANVIVNGGTYSHEGMDGSLAYIRKGSLTVNDGTFTTSGGGYGIAPLSGGKAVIKGGSFSANFLGWGGSISISGGTFKNKPNDDFLADGYKAVEIDGKYKVVANDVEVAATLNDVKDVFSTGGSVILADDIKFEKITPIEPGKEVYMDLNGKTITVEETTASNTLIWVKDGAKLTIDGNGTIDLGDVSTMAIFCPYGELVINNGTFIRNKVTNVTDATTGLFMGAKNSGCNVTINGGYFDAGYYDTNAADIEEILAGTATFTETADDIAKRGNYKDANLVRVAVKDNVSVLLNHSGWGSFKVYGGTFVGANPAWGDEGCMLPTTPNYLRPWSYYQGALLDGQTFNENGIVLPAGYNITKTVNADNVPVYTVEYNK